MWLAKGACGACGAPVARRAPLPGPCVARCNLCRASTPVHATRPRKPLLAAVAVLALVGYVVAATGPAAEIRWAVVEQSLVPERGPGGTVLRVETRAFDELGRELPAAPAGVAPAWSFAAAGTLVDPAGLAWTTCADALACRFDAGAAAFAYFTAFDPASALVNAFETRTGDAYLHVGEWSAWADPREAFRVTITRAPEG